MEQSRSSTTITTNFILSLIRNDSEGAYIGGLTFPGNGLSTQEEGKDIFLRGLKDNSRRCLKDNSRRCLKDIFLRCLKDNFLRCLKDIFLRCLIDLFLDA